MKAIRFISLVGALLVVLVGFAFAEGQGEAGAEKVKLTLGGWYTKDSLDATEKKVAKYSEENPNVTVDVQSSPDSSTFFQNLQAQIASKTAPDVFLIEPNVFHQLVNGGALARVDTIMDEVGYEVADIYDPLIDGYRVEGNLYAIPSDFNMLGLYYNRNMLDEAGVSVPSTYEELAAAARALTTDDVYGLSVDPIVGRIMPVLESFGDKIMEGGKPELTEQGTIEGMEYLLRLYNEEQSAATSKVLGTGWPGATFSGRKAAMVVSGTWTMGYLRNNVDAFEWGIAPMPEHEGKAAQLLFSGAYAVASSSEHKTEAVRFLKWYLNPESVLAGFKEGSQSIPVQKSYRDEVVGAFPRLEPLLALSNSPATSMFAFGENGQQFRDEFNASLEELVYKPGEFTVEEIFSELERKFQ